MKLSIPISKNFILFFLLSPIITISQNISEQKRDTLINISAEKVFLHIDRNIYSPGDDIWYKAYLFDDLTFLPAEASLNLHVELISSDGNIIDSNINYLENGIGEGNFHLNDSLPDGTYQIRAYTHYMRNFDDLLFFKRYITINGSVQTNSSENHPEVFDIDIQFMPEGGNLIGNITSLVAFKAVTSNDRSIDVKGTIYNNQGIPICNFMSLFRGMGYFSFAPKPGESYYAKLNEPESLQKYELPEVLSDGISLSVNYLRSDNIEIRISSPQQNFFIDTCKIIVQSRATSSVEKFIILKNPITRISIPKDGIPSGISIITLLNSKNIPLAERLIYIPLNNGLTVNIKQEKQTYGLREKVKLLIETKDKQGNPCQADLSLAVTDSMGWSCSTSNVPELCSYALLTSNFHGNIENPSYYFEKQDNNKLLQLDLVLLTNGWRRYIWKEISDIGFKKNIYGYEKGFSITGKVQHQVWNKPLINSKITLTSFGDNFLFLENKTDSIGLFRFENLIINDTTKIVIQAYNNKNEQESRIQLDINTYFPYPTTQFEPQIFKETISMDYQKNVEEKKFIEKMSILKDNIILDEIKIKGNKTKINDGHIRIHSNANYVIDSKEFTSSSTNIPQIMDVKIPGIRIYGTCPNLKHISLGASSSINSGRLPLLFLDGTRMEDLNFLCDLPPNTVDKIEVVKGPQASCFGFGSSNGVILVYTKRGGEQNIPFKLYGIEQIKPRAYQRIREFYSPNYAIENNLNKYKDLRTTIYWNPTVITSEQGYAEVTFYTTDKNARYNVIVQGFSEHGAMGFAKSIMEVNTEE